MVRAREREERPVLSIRFKRVFGAIYTFIIENISNTSAYNLKFTYYTNLKHKKEGGLPETNEIGLFKVPPKYIAPKQEFESVFLHLNHLEDEFIDTEVKYDIRYYDKEENHYDHSFSFDLRTLRQIMIMPTYEKQIIDALEKIVKCLDPSKSKGEPK